MGEEEKRTEEPKSVRDPWGWRFVHIVCQSLREIGLLWVAFAVLDTYLSHDPRPDVMWTFAWRGIALVAVFGLAEALLSAKVGGRANEHG